MSNMSSHKQRLKALMGDALERFEAGWPTAQESIFVAKTKRLAALVALLPRTIDEVGKTWPRKGTRALCVPPRETGAPAETLLPSEWPAILKRRELGLCVQLIGCESAFPQLATFLADLKAELGLGRETESTANIFMARAGAGFPRHRDSKDVWIIGLSGQKTVFTAPGNSLGPDHRTSIDDPPIPMPANSKQYTVARGDVLYIPRGCWHATRAETADTFSISIGLTRPWRAEVMANELLEILSRDTRWRRPIDTADEPIPSELVHELAERLAERVWKSGSAGAVTEGAYLRNSSATLSMKRGRLQVESCGELAMLTVSSKLDLTAFVAFVSSRQRLTARALAKRFPSLDSKECAVLLTLLYQAGFVRKAS